MHLLGLRDCGAKAQGSADASREPRMGLRVGLNQNAEGEAWGPWRALIAGERRGRHVMALGRGRTGRSPWRSKRGLPQTPSRRCR